eukprot:6762217-Pyramimonas_sp.AAC.1
MVRPNRPIDPMDYRDSLIGRPDGAPAVPSPPPVESRLVRHKSIAYGSTEGEADLIKPSHHWRIQFSRRFFTDTLGLDTDTVELTVTTLLSHLTTGEFNSPANSLRAPSMSELSPTGKSPTPTSSLRPGHPGSVPQPQNAEPTAQRPPQIRKIASPTQGG